jgi:hypothetical protein
MYTVKLHQEAIKGLTNEKLSDDYTFGFYSNLSPLWTSVHLVRIKGQWLIPSTLPDGAIAAYIMMAGQLLALDTLGFTSIPEGLPPLIITQIITCQVVLDIANGISLASLRGIKEKQLGDYRIVYSDNMVDSQLRLLMECVTNGLLKLGIGGASIGVKSKNAATGNYPGGKRTINNYNRINSIINNLFTSWIE